MASAVEDFECIARRVKEIRMARYHELGVSPPPSEPPQPRVSQAASEANDCDGFRYAPGFAPLDVDTTPE